MPYLKNIGGYQQSASKIFEQAFAVGTVIPHPGIYRCDACGFEIACTSGSALPTTDRCSEHAERWKCSEGQPRWRLVAAPIDTNG
jgi:hypothetical protein